MTFTGKLNLNIM